MVRKIFEDTSTGFGLVSENTYPLAYHKGSPYHAVSTSYGDIPIKKRIVTVLTVIGIIAAAIFTCGLIFCSAVLRNKFSVYLQKVKIPCQLQVHYVPVPLPAWQNQAIQSEKGIITHFQKLLWDKVSDGSQTAHHISCKLEVKFVDQGINKTYAVQFAIDNLNISTQAHIQNRFSNMMLPILEENFRKEIPENVDAMIVILNVDGNIQPDDPFFSQALWAYDNDFHAVSLGGIEGLTGIHPPKIANALRAMISD